MRSTSQKEFTLRKCRRRYIKKRNLALLCSIVLNHDELALYLYKKSKSIKRDMNFLLNERRIIKHTNFNLNVFSVQRSLADFRFKPKEIGRISELVGFCGITSRRRYYCCPVAATCIVLRRLATPTRWIDLEYLFGLKAPVMSEVFWECIESLIDNWGHVLSTFRTEFIRERANLYADAIKNNGAPLDSCIGFIDGTKIQMNRPSGGNHIQRACYSGHKRFHCLIYQTITTPDGIIFHMYGPEEGRRHDMTLYRNSGIDGIMANSLKVNERQF